MQNIISLTRASKKNPRRVQTRTYSEGWAYNAEAIAELARIKAGPVDPLLEARASYCSELAEMDFAEVVGELATVLDVVIELKFGERAERVAA